MPRCPAPLVAHHLALALLLCIGGPARAQAALEEAALRALAQQAASLEQAGQQQQALGLLRELARRTEEQQRIERERMAVSLRERFASERQTAQLERLRLEAERREAERRTQVAAQRLTIAVAVAALLVCAVLAQWLLLSRRRLRALRSDRARLQEQSARDPLTRLFNRRHGQQLLDELQETPPAGGVVLMLLDVDHFKRINDEHGHPAGDAVLQELARRLTGLVREGDLVARWGGEEFLLLLRSGSGHAMAMAERLLACVAGRPFDAGAAQPLAVTLSAGMAHWPAWPGETWHQALDRADQALYRAKSGGRNRAVLALVDGPERPPGWTELPGPAPARGEAA